MSGIPNLNPDLGNTPFDADELAQLIPSRWRPPDSWDQPPSQVAGS
jgi:hypothetical protein